MEATYTLAQEARTISHTIAALIEWLSAYVEHRPAELLTRQLTAPRPAAAPPAPPTATDVDAVVHYHAAMLLWLDDVRALLKRIPAGATALTLATLAFDALPADEDGAHAWDAMLPAELVMYVNNVDEAARLLAFYCGFLEARVP